MTSITSDFTFLREILVENDLIVKNQNELLGDQVLVESVIFLILKLINNNH